MTHDAALPPSLAYAPRSAAGDPPLPRGLRWLIGLWAFASLAQVVTYWTMLAFDRWQIVVWPSPFGLRRPDVEIAAAVSEALGLGTVLSAVTRPSLSGDRWRVALAAAEQKTNQVIDTKHPVQVLR